MPSLSTTGNVLPILEANQGLGNQSDATRLLHLSNRLQTSLALEDVLARFSEEIREYVPHDALAYNNSQHGIDFATGKQAQCFLNYQLTMKDRMQLGSISLSRKHEFSEEEARELEHLLSALLYPLRNALLYRSAIRAAHKDALTGTGNRAALDEALDREVELAHRHHRSLGMIVIDIDHFKGINDTYGHSTGDCLIKALANTTENTIRISDQLFRFGGEEFVVLLPETSISGVQQLAERIRRNVEALECVCEGNRIKMTASFGVALLKEDEDEEAFFVRADKALYQAKSDGRNRTCVAE